MQLIIRGDAGMQVACTGDAPDISDLAEFATANEESKLDLTAAIVFGLAWFRSDRPHDWIDSA